MSTKVKKTDPRVKRTRHMFKEALVSLSQEQDPNKLTVQDIAERATLNRVTFYLHFRDLDDLIKQTADEILDELFAIVSSDPSTRTVHDYEMKEPPPKLLLMLEHFYKNAALYAVMLEKSLYFKTRMFEVIKDIISLGTELRKSNGHSLTVPQEIMVPAFFGVLSWWLQSGTPYSPSYLAQQLWLLQVKGPYTVMK